MASFQFTHRENAEHAVPAIALQELHCIMEKRSKACYWQEITAVDLIFLWDKRGEVQMIMLSVMSQMIKIILCF